MKKDFAVSFLIHYNIVFTKIVSTVLIIIYIVFWYKKGMVVNFRLYVFISSRVCVFLLDDLWKSATLTPY